MKDKNGKLVYTSSEISNIFQDFLGKEDGINIFFQKLKLPKVSNVDRNLLDAEIKSEEAERAITNLKNGKACGPDGLPS